MENQKTTFALFFGNRGLFPASLIASARKELSETLKKLGHRTLLLEAGATRHGAIETPGEGRIYAEFLRRHQGKFGGVIVCLPNFGDETGAVAALQDAGVPILVQAYPDELDKMASDVRRDAFCGKFSIMDMFCQYGIRFTTLPPHAVHPTSARFAEQIDHFDRVCRTVKAMKNLVVGAIGARTTAFKTVRIDEVALQRHGITLETYDLSDVFARMEKLKVSDARLRAKTRRLAGYCSWKGVPKGPLDQLSRLGVIIDEVIEANGLQAVAIRCWLEMQTVLGVSPCVLLSEMNDRGVVAACEVDVGNAVCMYALGAASGRVTTCLDWNNNYGEEENKCILFHCGPVPQTMMTGPGRIVDHDMLVHAAGQGRCYGCNAGRIAPTPMTFGSLLTDQGRLKFYLGQGRFTDDPIPAEFFGCAGVAEIENLQTALQTIGYAGHRHHTSVTPGHVLEPVREAFQRYLGYEVTVV